MADSVVSSPESLSPLPPVLHRGLTAISFFGFLSFFLSVALFLRLAHRLINWKRQSQQRLNQFYILIFNLVFADIQQSIAFLLNAQWLRENAIDVGSTTCWAQGWFISTGDLASGVFTFAIAVHSFFDIVWDYRLGPRMLMAVIVFLWTFVYAMAITGVALHPDDFYVRAGAWCWINVKYKDERLWLHYFWIIIAEFGTVLIYCLTFLILRRRVKESFYTTSDTQTRAQGAAKIIIAYPIAYVVCTLPLVTARLSSMAGQPVTFVELCVAGAMITSNGWLDVVMYTLTRRSMVFGSVDDLGEGRGGVIETFRTRPDEAYGVTTTIESMARRPSSRHRRKGSMGLHQRFERPHSRHGSQEQFFPGVKAETVVQVRTDTLELEPMGLHGSKERTSLDTRSLKSLAK